MFTDNQLQILTILVNQPDKDYYMSELGGILRKHPGIFQRGINSLEKQGLILSYKRGNQRLFKINRNSPLFNEIKLIVQKTYGVEGLLRSLFNKIQTISLALIYGSYAKDKMHLDSDVDILVAADDLSAEDSLLNEIGNLEKKLQREINYKFYLKNEFFKKKKTNDPFIKEILSDKYILLKGKL